MTEEKIKELTSEDMNCVSGGSFLPVDHCDPNAKTGLSADVNPQSEKELPINHNMDSNYYVGSDLTYIRRQLEENDSPEDIRP